MKKAAVYSLVMGILALGLCFAGQKGPAGWKGTIATENGIKVVRNPAEPLYGTFAFDLEENLAIGGDPIKEDYYFPKGAAVRPDEKGNLFVADFGNKRVQMYDRAGRFVGTIGRQGQGPGEYQHPHAVLIDESGNLYVGGASEIVVFGPDGTFKRKISLRTFLSRHAIGPGGTIIGTTQPSPRDGWKQQIVQADPEGITFKTIAEYVGDLAKGQKGVVLHWYSYDVGFSPLSAETFAYGFSADYRISVADAKGEPVLAFTKDENPLPISGREKEATRKDGYFAWYGRTYARTENPGEDSVFPDHRPYFPTMSNAMQNDDRGRLYIIRAKSILEREGPSAVDVFSKDGYYLYRMTWRSFPSAIKGGFLYEVREDKETSEYQVVRYRIKNWNSMT